MFKNKWMIGIFILFSLTTAGQAFNKDALTLHILKALNITSEAEVSLSDPVPSEFPGFLEVEVTLFKQKQKIFITEDGKKYFWGTVFDTTTDPDQERMALMDMNKAHFKGDKNALVTVVEYSDLQCPYCSKAHLTLDSEIYKAFSPKDVKVVFKHFPLKMHDWAVPGAVATECAAEQSEKAFWDMSNYLFRNAGSITAENFSEKSEAYAKELKLNMRRFKTCTTSEAAELKVKKDLDEGLSLGVNSTPTFYVNGRKLRGFKDIESIKPLINEQLSAARKKK